MDQRQNPDQTVKPKWRRWSYRAFVAANVVGIVLAIPVLIATLPLLKVWWDTRSIESVSRRPATASRHTFTNPAREAGESDRIHGTSERGLPNLESLTNQLSLVGKLNEEELRKIAAYQYGPKKQNLTDPKKFDRDSAILHKISRTLAEMNGKDYYCYEVDLVDENGNHKVHQDFFEKPDLDYERGMATLEVVNSNPQLKKIYETFAHVMAERSAEDAGSNSEREGKETPIRVEKDPSPSP